jgi:hypothetical protein
MKIIKVDQILAAKNTPSACGGHPSTRGELPNADTSALERQIDEMVYKLYDLTEDEIAIIEGTS